MGDARLSPDIVLKFADGFLRPLKVEDVHSGYTMGLNDPEVNRYLDGVKQVIQTDQSVTEFVRRNQQANDAVLFGIWQTDTKLHSGTVRLHGIDNYHMTANIGICLFDRSAWGNKLGLKATKAVTRWAFESLGLRWIEAGAYSTNIASQKNFIAAGYEWIYDVPDKYLLEGRPTRVKVYAARNLDNQINTHFKSM